MEDIYMVALRFGYYEGEPDYTPAFDLNGDKVIDLRDLLAVATKFGTTV
jgi:hypothetical protein